MWKYIYLISLSIISGMVSCKKLSDECDESLVCLTDAPDSLFIELQLSPAGSGEHVLVRFYEGNVDDGDLYLEFITTNDKEYFYMANGENYAAEAIYQRGNDTIKAIDGDWITPEYFYNCEEKCYEWDEDIIFDLTLNE